MKLTRQYNLGVNWHDVPENGEIPVDADTLRRWSEASWRAIRGATIKIRDIALFEKGDKFDTPGDTLTYTILHPEVITGKKDGKAVEYIACMAVNNKTGESWPQHCQVSNILKYKYRQGEAT